MPTSMVPCASAASWCDVVSGRRINFTSGWLARYSRKSRGTTSTPALGTKEKRRVPVLPLAARCVISTESAAFARLNAELTSVLRTPEMQEQLRKIGAEPETASPQAYGRYVRAEADKWASVVHTAGIGQ
jgi:hypothetical protein